VSLITTGNGHPREGSGAGWVLAGRPGRLEVGGWMAACMAVWGRYEWEL